MHVLASFKNAINIALPPTLYPLIVVYFSTLTPLFTLLGFDLCLSTLYIILTLPLSSP